MLPIRIADWDFFKEEPEREILEFNSRFKKKCKINTFAVYNMQINKFLSYPDNP